MRNGDDDGAELSRSPELRAGVVGWRADAGEAQIRFLGKGLAPDSALDPPAAWLPAGIRRARLRQVHGSSVVTAQPGDCGVGDGLVSSARALVLEIATADCVPVLLASSELLGALHAGWRGIAAGVVAETLGKLGEPGELSVWIGPAIGSCCYEVAEEVAEIVVAASAGGVRSLPRAGRGRPHLDLQLAVTEQLRAAGVHRIRTLAVCTACHPQWLWSYRRDGDAAGRNLALVWRAA